MKASELREELLSMSQVKHEETVDTWKAGDPEKEIHKVAVCFIITKTVLEKAKAWGADLIITHEPTFYTNLDILGEDEVSQEKKRLVEASGITIVRFHDHMHLADPDLIHKGFLEALPISYHLAERALAEFDRPMTPRELAKMLREKLDLSCIRLIGNTDFPATRFHLGLGDTNSDLMLERLKAKKAQVLLCGETCEWKVGEFVRDAGEMGFPMAMLILGHAGSERDGMKALASFLQKKHPDLAFSYLECGEIYQTF